MIARHADAQIAVVAERLMAFPRLAIAVSGGIDSLTLATIAGRHHPEVEAYHAISPAVPVEATERVRELADREGWTLREIDAGEFGDEAYLANPVNRCFFCKQSLYATVAAIAGATSAQIVSGTNADDLGEYRPGLDAARAFGVRHPFAELAIGKREIRDMARALGMRELSALPSSPCLSSRIESGIRIDPATLSRVHRAETTVRALVPHAEAVRCRVRSTGVSMEIDAATLSALDHETCATIAREVAAIMERHDEVTLVPYRTGSAFLVTMERATRE